MIYPAAIPFVLVHVAALVSAFLVDWTWGAVALVVALYVVRMWGLTAGFHRYFSHRSYKTSRLFQFILAFIGQSSAQRGVIWWSAVHRHHHLHSDTPQDVHSPKHSGFFFSHVGWIFSQRNAEPDYSSVPDLTRYPELRWLERHPYLPAALLGAACFLVGGWLWLVAFLVSTVILYHGTFSINSVAHVHGKQRYVTGDESKNNWLLALITLGEGWHNNHHHYQSSTRQGFYWWEIDITYYVLKVLSWIGLVRDLRAPPREIVANEKRLGRKVVEKVAHEVAASWNPEAIARQVREAWDGRPSLDELKVRLRQAREEAEARLADIHLPHVPTVDELRERIEERFSDTPSLDEIAIRAREILVERVAARLLNEPEPLGSLG
ncbi:MAG: acyl-CoA desaturase [Gemmatimonadetes bacterium]|nr:acyl-CoA desaturase [Gemmatimonadota bacterium]NIR77352.1 acyl-CoA desaturase [Gemmatimonadota bacterium]NIT85878.1 acyl-CoA desaturase [Gemmatimonadota bacterium]NIU29700.1 acyl-CoA desaturase [Gemmatimonadota bacterium]NIU34731.1 acyl-CoA desaturase [Gemmatimonadota bacterium]